ncbi:MAG: MFS transporter [Thaumarchaeota archaeon]|nr:MFS transporter [Nitrososphaerota archaeon]
MNEHPRIASYSLLAASWLCWTWVWSMRMMFPTIMPAIEDGLNLSSSDAYALVGVFNLATGASFFLFGRAADRSSRKLVVLVGLSASVASALILSQLSAFGGLLAVSIATGFFLGAYLPSGTAVLSDSYPKERMGFVLSIHETGASTGQTLGTLLVSGGILFLGWRQIFGWWTLAGLAPILLYFFVAPKGTPPKEQNRTFTGKSNWTKTQTLLMLLIYVGILSGITGFVSVLPVYLVQVFGVAIFIEALIIGLTRIPAPLGQVLAGRFSDRHGRKPLILAISLIVAATTAVMALVPFGLLFIVALFVQFSAGAAFFPIMLAWISDVTSPNEMAGKIGIGMSGGSILGAGLVPVVIGFLAPLYGYQTAFIFPMGLMLIGIAAVILLNFKKDQNSHSH